MSYVTGVMMINKMMVFVMQTFIMYACHW